METKQRTKVPFYPPPPRLYYFLFTCERQCSLWVLITPNELDSSVMLSEFAHISCMPAVVEQYAQRQTQEWRLGHWSWGLRPVTAKAQSRRKGARPLPTTQSGDAGEGSSRSALGVESVHHYGSDLMDQTLH